MHLDICRYEHPSTKIGFHTFMTIIKWKYQANQKLLGSYGKKNGDPKHSPCTSIIEHINSPSVDTEMQNMLLHFLCKKKRNKK